MNLERVSTHIFPEVRHRYTERDTMLYALGVNACQDPLNERELSFVYEGAGLQALPSYVCVLARPGFMLHAPGLEIDWSKVLHAEQHFELHAPLPSAGEIVSRCRIRGVLDKGPKIGAFLYVESTLLTATGTALATVGTAMLLRGDGGCGSFGVAGPELRAVPAGAPDGAIDIGTPPTAALLYRLSGDDNPLHADPASARRAGFERPILHGLCTYGIAGHALIRALADYDATRLEAMSARFVRPVYPGETLRIEYWTGEQSGIVHLRCSSLERELIVLDRGTARISPGSASR
jgi:acyl dehydratase